MTEDEAGALGWMIRTVDWSESKCGEINPKGRYTGLVRDPSEQQAHNRGGVQEGHPWIHGRGIKTAGFSHKGCNLPSTDVPNFSSESRNVAAYLWCPLSTSSICINDIISGRIVLSSLRCWLTGRGRPPETTPARPPTNQPTNPIHRPHSSSSESSSPSSWWT